MMNMKLAALMVAAAALAMGCDDISKPVNSPFLPSVANKEGLPPRILAKEDYREIYNFLTSTRAEMRAFASAIEKDKEAENLDEFMTKRGLFRRKKEIWSRMLEVRIEWIENTPKPESVPDYPGYELLTAGKLLIRETNSYLSYFLGQRSSIDPFIDRDLLEALDRAGYLLDKYEDPPEFMEKYGADIEKWDLMVEGKYGKQPGSEP